MMSNNTSMKTGNQRNWLFLTRKYDFPASHRLFNPAWSDEENERFFRQCNNPNGHGHNYELEVTVKGEPDPRLGMVVDIYELDQIVKRAVLDKVDHKNLNVDVDFMQGLIPTAENIVVAIWQELAPHIPAPAKLSRLRLVETRNNMAEYRGE
jgi:6-pyruvoyltetrahydropterin/6-carboxytetrahydropterin synthase